MLKTLDSGRGVVRRLGLAAAAVLALSAVPQRAEALSLINPGAAPTAKAASGGLTMEVRGGHGGGGGGSHGGGGGGFHGGGFHSAGAVFHGGGFRAGPVFHGGGYRSSGLRYGGYRFAHHHHFHRHFFYGASYYPYDDYPYYYSYRRCRVILTHYGPRRVCHYRPWRHHTHWRQHHHRHHHVRW
jgi:hypothetical protein